MITQHVRTPTEKIKIGTGTNHMIFQVFFINKTQLIQSDQISNLFQSNFYQSDLNLLSTNFHLRNLIEQSSLQTQNFKLYSLKDVC